MFGGTAATKSTLVKRGPKEHPENADNAGDPPAKRVKVEGGASDVDDETKRNFEKGTVSKVRINSFIASLCYVTNLCFLGTAYDSYFEGVPDISWSFCGR